MNSEKVKEIKKALECCANWNGQASCKDCPIGIEKCYEDENLMPRLALTLINELESENERWQEKEGALSCDLDLLNEKLTNAEIEVDDYKDRIALLEKDNELLRNAKVVYENVDYCYEDLKKAEKRIAELEKKNGELLKENEGYHGSYRCAIDKIGELSAEIYIKLEQFAEKLKEKLRYTSPTSDVLELSGLVFDGIEVEQSIDETLKEFISGTRNN